MTPLTIAALAALLLYLALRVVQMKRRSLPFLVAYPLFVLILWGGAIIVFVVASNVAAGLALAKEAALVVVYGATGIATIALWLIARRIIT